MCSFSRRRAVNQCVFAFVERFRFDVRCHPSSSSSSTPSPITPHQYAVGEGMRKLRIPTNLCTHLPSIRKYAPSLSDGKTDVIDLSNEPDEIVMQVSE